MRGEPGHQSFSIFLLHFTLAGNIISYAIWTLKKNMPRILAVRLCVYPVRLLPAVPGLRPQSYRQAIHLIGRQFSENRWKLQINVAVLLHPMVVRCDCMLPTSSTTATAHCYMHWLRLYLIPASRTYTYYNLCFPFSISYAISRLGGINSARPPARPAGPTEPPILLFRIIHFVGLCVQFTHINQFHLHLEIRGVKQIPFNCNKSPLMDFNWFDIISLTMS